MKKIGLFILGLCALFCLGNFTQAKEYEYTNLDITADVLIDGTINVTENFTTNFFVQKHGIIRDIPLNYTVSNYAFHIDISNVNVAGKNFTTSKQNGNIEIKIGDADRTVIGEQNYPISYTTYGLIRNFSGLGYAELYWNIVGYGFDTNINKVRATIYLPKPYTGFTSDNFLITTDGTSKTVEEFKGTVDWSNGDKIIITYDKPLPAYHGITLSMNLPKDYFTFDHDRQSKLVGHVAVNKNSSRQSGNSISPIMSSIYFVILPIGIVAIFIMACKTSKNLNDKIGKKGGALKGEFAKQFPVIIQYEPPKGLNSAEVGLLLHRGAKAKDMLSLIYKRAAEGLISLSIEEDEGSFFKKATNSVIITKNKDISADLPKYERDLFTSLIYSGKNKIDETSNLYNKLNLSDLEEYGESKGWLTANKLVKRMGVIMLGMFILCMIIPFLIPIAIIAFFIVALAGGSDKFQETEEGAKLISHILGYREFLAACDENKLRLFLQEDPLYFDKILPYAVVFGLDTELIKKFKPIMQEMNIKSSFYDGNFDSINVINDTISSSATHSVPPSTSSYSSSDGFSSGSSSSGGGFSSGGGGGGGGGRSW